MSTYLTGHEKRDEVSIPFDTIVWNVQCEKLKVCETVCTKPTSSPGLKTAFTVCLYAVISERCTRRVGIICVLRCHILFGEYQIKKLCNKMFSLLCVGFQRSITITEESVTKRFQVHHHDKKRFLMGNELELFYREADISLHISEKKSICNTTRVPHLLNVNFRDFSITSTTVGKPITSTTMPNVCKTISFKNIQMQINEMKSFFNCSGIVLCDVKPKNMAIFKNQLYVFDFDAAFL